MKKKFFVFISTVLFLLNTSTLLASKLEVKTLESIKQRANTQKFLYINNQLIIPECFDDLIKPDISSSHIKSIKLKDCFHKLERWKKSYNPITNKSNSADMISLSKGQEIWGYTEKYFNQPNKFLPFGGNKTEWIEFNKRIKENQLEISSYRIGYDVKDVNNNEAIIFLYHEEDGIKPINKKIIKLKLIQSDQYSDKLDEHLDFELLASNYTTLDIDCIESVHFLNQNTTLIQNISAVDALELIGSHQFTNLSQADSSTPILNKPCYRYYAGTALHENDQIVSIVFDEQWLKEDRDEVIAEEKCLKNYVLNWHNKGKNLTIKANDFERFKQAYQQACPMVK